MALTRSSSPLAAALLGGGLLAFLLGERVAAPWPLARAALSGLGALAVLASVALRFWAAARATGDRRRIERLLGAAGLVVAIALAMAFSTTDAGESATGIAKLAAAPRAKLEAVLSVGWATLLLAGALPTLFAEIALAPMRRATHVEGRRVRAAALAGLTVGLAIAYVSLFTYAAGELGVKADFSYFRTARPGDSTRNVARSATEPVRAVAFFPQLNEVGREVDGYLRDLAGVSPSFTVEMQDRLLAPALAKELKVSSDGVIVLTHGKLRQTLTIGTDMNVARPKLKSLDADFQKALLQVLREQKVAYLTVGHGELNEATSSPEGRTATGLRKLLEQQSYSVKELGLAQGLGSEVPNDATIVLVLGPTQPFQPGEVESLRRFGEKGGKLLLALDPDARIDDAPLAAIAGLSWQPQILANDRIYLQRGYNDADRTILVTNRYSSHASVTTLSRNASRAPVILAGAAALDKLPNADGQLKIDFAVKSMPDTFADANGDFRFGPDEKRSTWNLGAAVSKALPAPDGAKDKPEMRAFVLGDADALSDAYLGSDPNVLLALDVVRWLGGEESFAGSIATTEDVKIEHTRQKDVIWFYASILGVPSIVLALGLAYVRRGRGAGRRAA